MCLSIHSAVTVDTTGTQTSRSDDLHPLQVHLADPAQYDRDPLRVLVREHAVEKIDIGTMLHITASGLSPVTAAPMTW